MIRAARTLFALIAVVAATSGCDAPEGEVVAAVNRVDAVPVSVVRAAVLEVVDSLYSVGRVVSRNQAVLGAEVNARVDVVRVEVGQPVRRGEVLVELDVSALRLERREASAEIQRIEASIENERRRVGRYRDLRKRDMIALEALDDAEAQLDVEQASRAAAAARLAVIDDRLEKSIVRAPVDGVVAERFVAVGDYVKQGDDLLELVDERHLRAELPFPETVAGRLAIGQQVFISSPLVPALEVEARVDQIKPDVGLRSRAVSAIVLLTNPGPWRPDATVQARVVVERRPHAVVVPRAAVVTRPSGQVVYVLAEGTARERVVEAGALVGQQLEITAGLAPDEDVIVEGASYLTNGVGVAVIEPSS
ncbi:MAG: efflux RND transporter periplasmic adaptor subunit [Gammaproteobacteria bacterium]